jgi:tetratricopeptide (TPR) repeat protein
MRHLIIAVSLALGTAAAVAERQAPAFDLLRQWRAAVDAHAPGERDAMADTLSAWPPGALDDVADSLRRLRILLDRARADGLSPTSAVEHDGPSITVADASRLLGLSADDLATFLSGTAVTSRAIADAAGNRVAARAAVLHLDIALLVPPGVRLPRSDRGDDGRATLNVLDGRARGVEYAGNDHTSVHRAFGEQLMGRLTPTSASLELARLWYRATTAELLLNERYGDAAPMLTRAVGFLPDDATLLFYTAVLHETFASPRIQSVLQSIDVPEGYRSEVGPPREELGLAQLYLTQSLRIDPDRLDARVRLGRVLGLLGRPGDARETLERVLPDISDQSDRPLRYYALLFLGDQHRALGAREAARAAYEQAGHLYLRAQTPRLAVSQLERQFSNRAEAVEAMWSVIARRVGRDRRDDPWWTYHSAHVADAEALIDQLRRALVNGGAG